MKKKTLKISLGVRTVKLTIYSQKYTQPIRFYNSYKAICTKGHSTLSITDLVTVSDSLSEYSPGGMGLYLASTICV